MSCRVLPAVLCLFALWGCREPQSIIPIPDGGTAVPTEPVEIRILGVDADAYTHLYLDVASLSATADGKPLEVELGPSNFDLAIPDQAWLVGRVLVPEGAEAIDVTLKLDDGGAYESAAGSGAIDARGVIVRWTSPAAAFTLRHHAVVEVDVERSIVAMASWRRALLPVLAVRH